MKTRLFLIKYLLVSLVIVFSSVLFADDKYAPLTVKLSEDGKKFVRFITWHQLWFTTSDIGMDTRTGSDENVNDSDDFNVDASIRRSRVLILAKFTPKFLLLTHFGVNNVGLGNLTPLGNDALTTTDSSVNQLFFHDAWGEYQIGHWLYIGAGLHYWNGLNRLANASTLNLLTLDAPRPFAGWHAIGYTSQFARHLGLYVKGAIEKFDYRVAFNRASEYDAFGGGTSYGDNTNNASTVVYGHQHRSGSEDGSWIISGYFRYNIFSPESITLPYAVGTYLGGKRVLAVGAGFFAHPAGARDIGDGTGVDGVAGTDDDTATVGGIATTNAANVDVIHASVDVFGEFPFGQNASGGSLTFYLAGTLYNYGENFVARWAGTGVNIYAQVGYMTPVKWLQPYVGFQIGLYDGLNSDVWSLNAGLNFLIVKHHAKVTLEWHQIENQISGAAENTEEEGRDDVNQIRVQAHFFI